jgi:hypothetical protein
MMKARTATTASSLTPMSLAWCLYSLCLGPVFAWTTPRNRSLWSSFLRSSQLCSSSLCGQP